jgi:hypothetical protein
MWLASLRLPLSYHCAGPWNVDCFYAFMESDSPSISLFYASKKVFVFYYKQTSMLLCFFESLFYIFIAGISQVIGTKHAFCVAYEFWCLWVFCWSRLITNIKALLYKYHAIGHRSVQDCMAREKQLMMQAVWVIRLDVKCSLPFFPQNLHAGNCRFLLP